MLLCLDFVAISEGTTMNTKQAAASREFAKGTGRPDNLQHTLLPRSKGLQALIEAMLKEGKNPEIVDVTLVYDGYSGEVPTWEMGVSGACLSVCVKLFDGSFALLCDL
jgi:hypothetical protein